MKTTLVLAMLALVVSGKSIDNPAEKPDMPGGMVQAVRTVDESVREAKSLAVPPPVQVTSGVVTVLGDAREGRVIEIGDDGIPIIHGVRVPDDLSDTKIYRNARIVNNKLITAEDEVRANGVVEGRSLSDHSRVTSSGRQARILPNRPSFSFPSSSSSSSFNPAGHQGPKWSSSSSSSSLNPAAPQGAVSPAAAETQQYPDFYYKKYFDNERIGVIAEASFEDDNISTSSEQVVSYSYLASPEGGARIDGTISKDVVYGAGSAAKPPSQSASATQFKPTKSASVTRFEPAKTSVLQSAEIVKPVVHQSFEPSNSIGSFVPSVIANSISNAVPFGHSTTPAESFAVHQTSLSTSGNRGHSTSQILRQIATHPPHAPPTVFQSNPHDFVIQDTTFQAHPGAPTFNIPIPVPTKQAKLRRHPNQRNQIQASSELVEHSLPATGDLSYTNYQPYYEVATTSTKKPIYKKMMEPFMKAGQQFYAMASPVLSPMINAGHRLSQSFRLPQTMPHMSEMSLEKMNDYISRTVSDQNLPLVAGVAAVAALGIAALAVAASSNITIGKRSVDDPTEEFLYQMLDPYPMGEPTLLDHLEEYTSWTDSKCSKRIFCDVMTHVGDDYLYTIEKRLDMFLRMLNRGSAEETALKRTADDVMLAVRQRKCNSFSCGGTDVDSSQVSRSSAGPR